MSFQPGQQINTAGAGLRPENLEVPAIMSRNPGVNDTNYPIGKRWINTADQTEFYLNNLTSTNALLQANWVGIGGLISVENVEGDDGVIVPPTGNILNMQGNTVANGTYVKPLYTSGNAGTSTETINVQVAAAIASTNINNAGIAAFNSADFTVDANGFVSFSGTGAGETITGSSGGPLSPTGGNWNLYGTGSITTVGSGSTLTTELTGLTAHSVLVGAGTATITKVGPSSTSGQVLQSQGASADPAYSTATYPSTTTINQILYSSAANTVSGLATVNNGVLITGTTGVPSLLADGTTGQVLTATAGSPPSWAAIPSNFNSINIQTFASSGTYTPTAGMLYCIIELVGSGGGGGGTQATNVLNMGCAAGGGSGGYSIGVFSASSIGASKSVTVGTGGAGGVGNSNGSAGGTTSVGVLISAGGGGGGGAGVTTAGASSEAGSPGGPGSGGSLNSYGQSGWNGFSYYTGNIGFSGAGGNTIFGPGGGGLYASTSLGVTNGSNGGYGGGGSGAAAGQSQSAGNGGAGGAGFVKITEFI